MENYEEIDLPHLPDLIPDQEMFEVTAAEVEPGGEICYEVSWSEFCAEYGLLFLLWAAFMVCMTIFIIWVFLKDAHMRHARMLI